MAKENIKGEYPEMDRLGWDDNQRAEYFFYLDRTNKKGGKALATIDEYDKMSRFLAAKYEHAGAQQQMQEQAKQEAEQQTRFPGMYSNSPAQNRYTNINQQQNGQLAETKTLYGNYGQGSVAPINQNELSKYSPEMQREILKAGGVK